MIHASDSPQRSVSRWYYAVDHLGSPRSIYDANGMAVAIERYFPFGEQVGGSGGIDTLKFTGHQRDLFCCDGTTQQRYSDNMHARQYAPMAGRFFSPDPVLGNLLRPQSWNRYAYVLNNPATFIDPDGMLPQWGYGGGSGDLKCDIKGCEISVTARDPMADIFDWLNERWNATPNMANPVTGMTVREHWRASSQGAAAFADGAIPFGDPLQNMFELYGDGSVEGLEYSRTIGEYTRNLEMP